MIAAPEGTGYRVPKISAPTTCGHRGPRYACNRPAGHTGRHLFAWRHLGGIVRGVWGCHGHLKPGYCCAECGAYRGED